MTVPIQVGGVVKKSWSCTGKSVVGRHALGGSLTEIFHLMCNNNHSIKGKPNITFAAAKLVETCMIVVELPLPLCFTHFIRDNQRPPVHWSNISCSISRRNTRCVNQCCQVSGFLAKFSRFLLSSGHS